MGGQSFRQAILLAGTMVVARYVTPEHFGWVAMVTAPLAVLEVIREFGMLTVCVQAPDLDGGKASALFWFNAFAGLGMFALILLAAPWMAAFYRTPAVAPISAALGAGLLAASLSIQHVALLRRAMQFGRLAALETAAAAVSVLAGIGVAIAGGGYWAIVAQILVSRGIGVAGSWLLCPWRPGWAMPSRVVRGLLRNGAHLTGNSLLGSLTRSLDAVILARVADGVSVGCYTRGLSISQLPVGVVEGPVSTIAVSALSALHAEPARRDAAAILYLRGLTAAMTALALGLTLAPDWIVGVVLGRQWDAVVPLLRWLALLAVALPLANAAAAIASAYDTFGRLFRATLVSVAIVAASVIWGALGGAHRLVITYSLGSLAAALLLLAAVLARAIPGPLTLGRAVGPPLLAGAAGWAAAQAAGRFLTLNPPLLSLAKTAIAEGLFLAWACLAFDLPIRLRDLFRAAIRGRP